MIYGIEKNILLPIVYYRIIVLNLDRYSIKTYNVMEASVAFNAMKK